MQKTKLVIDTNIWVGYLLGKNIRSYLDKIIADTRFEIFTDQNSILELQLVLNRSKFGKYITPAQSENLIALIQRRSISVNVLSNIIKSRDPKDDFLLSLSIDCGADYLITGDKDLLVFQKIETTSIIKIADFDALFYPKE